MTLFPIFTLWLFDLGKELYYNAIFPDFDALSNRNSLNNTEGADEYKVSK